MCQAKADCWTNVCNDTSIEANHSTVERRQTDCKHSGHAGGSGTWPITLRCIPEDRILLRAIGPRTRRSDTVGRIME